jgi:membrane complex biogenesis BtpA family protein
MKSPTPGTGLLSPDRCALVGMVHLLPLPGSPRWAGDMQAVLDAARRDAEALLTGGCDLLLVENMGDVPYLRGGVPPETVAAMARATAAVVAFGLPTGVQVLAAANREALGVAVASGARFIRVEGFAYAHVADEGWIDASAGPLLRARSALGSAVEVWADIQKKHSAHAVTADLSLAEWAHGAAFCGADAVVVTGTATGRPTASAHVKAAASSGCPVVVGSGVNPDNVTEVADTAAAVIVGSWLKVDGLWPNPVDGERVRRLRGALGE